MMNITDVESMLSEANRHQSLQYLASVILVCVCFVLGTVGNIIVCVVYSSKARKSNSNIFILHLSIYDLVVSVIVLPFMLAVLLNTYTFNSPVVCAICFYTEYIFTGASSIIMVSIALDRYNKICRPLQPGLSERLSKWLFWITIIIGASLTCLVPLLYGNQKVLYEDGTGLALIGTTCGIQHSIQRSTLHFIHIYVLLSAFLLIYLLMIVFYVLVGFRMWKRGRQIQATRGTQLVLTGHTSVNVNPDHVSVVSNETLTNTVTWTNRNSPRRTRDLCRVVKMSQIKSISTGSKTSLMLFLVSLVFLLSWLPFWIIAVKETRVESHWNTSLPPPPEPPSSRFGRSLFLVNHAVNPIIYSVVSKTFRTDCRYSFSRLRMKLRARLT